MKLTPMKLNFHKRNSTIERGLKWKKDNEVWHDWIIYIHGFAYSNSYEHKLIHLGFVWEGSPKPFLDNFYEFSQIENF